MRRAVRHRVHRQAELHDDLDLAFALVPPHRIRLDPSLHVRVLDALPPPWERWAARLRGGGAGSDVGPPPP